MQGNTFKKGERLKSRKVIGQLFKEGHSFGQYPLRLVWLLMEERQSEYPVQFTQTVPKKKFKRAVDRNRLRRQVREAYRLHKGQLYEALKEEEQQLAFMVIYTGKEAFPYAEIEKAMKKMIRKFSFTDVLVFWCFF